MTDSPREVAELVRRMVEGKDGIVFADLFAEDGVMEYPFGIPGTPLTLTGREAINVTFLSGSQRFRVAVSLALGIGQYASRRHRPIESVIIDEGFGCLDRQGRQAMIDELQRLRQFLRRIILVSHQEEFAEAFSVGFRLTSGPDGTTAERFRR